MSEKPSKPCPEGKHRTTSGRCYPNERKSKLIKTTASRKEMKMTYEIAMAAGKDAANEHMRKEGRTSWNQDDYRIAVETFEKLWPEEHDFTASREALMKEMEEPTLESVSRKIREANSLGKKLYLTPKEMAIRRRYGLFGIS